MSVQFHWISFKISESKVLVASASPKAECRYFSGGAHLKKSKANKRKGKDKSKIRRRKKQQRKVPRKKNTRPKNIPKKKPGALLKNC